MQVPLIFIGIKDSKSYVIDINKIISIIKTSQKVHPTNNVIMNRIQKTIRLVSMAKTCILPSEEATVYFKMLKEAGNACDIAPFEIFLKN